MSAGGAFGGSRGYQPRAPEKGVFPLDHFGECKQVGLLCFACMLSLCTLQTNICCMSCFCRYRSNIWHVSRRMPMMLRNAESFPSCICSAGWTGERDFKLCCSKLWYIMHEISSDCALQHTFAADTVLLQCQLLRADHCFISTFACFWHLLSLYCGCHRNLMARQDLKELGFKGQQQQTAAQNSKPDTNANKQKQGFIAGVRR